MIKFRAWNDREKEYIKYVLIGSNGKIYFDDGIATQDDLDIRIEQFTGLKDVNGKEIYEGDIVHGYDQEPDRDDGYIGSSVTDIVNFKYGAFWIGDSWYRVMVMTPPIVEVIGNVHANSELLEEDK
ncbi:hypothetical protein IMAU80174_03023 [Lactiplantibacillus plantarum]|nr:hypothetical protein [Lactiplantibacillus plantarum]MCG0694509.1 hypothetical protein [Lactiplantibacillus plantarum]